MEAITRIKKLGKDDVQSFQDLIAVFHEAFEMEDRTQVDRTYLERLLAKPDFMVFVALQGQQVVGGLTAFELPLYHTECSEILVYDLGVHPQFQRQGIGQQLMAAIQEYGRSLGVKTIVVPAHQDDTHALEFYRSTGGQAEQVVLFTYE